MNWAARTSSPLERVAINSPVMHAAGIFPASLRAWLRCACRCEYFLKNILTILRTVGALTLPE
jgi:hypothetical protein